MAGTGIPGLRPPFWAIRKKKRDERITATLPGASRDASEPATAEPDGTSTPTRDPGRSFAATVARIDGYLVAVTLILAFLLGSFAVRNSDVWLHLATGRLVATGHYSFGVDPFSYTTAGTYWANHSWLFDLGLYLLTSIGGPQGLGGILAVVAKGLLVVVLAGFMLSVRRRGQSLWLPAMCVTLALVCMAPRLILLQSTELSYLFLGVTLAVLVREGRAEPRPGMSRTALLFTNAPERLHVLPPLFVLWVNSDAWFFLGPVTVALYLLGERWQTRASDRPEDLAERQALLLTLGVGLAACLINPHHVYAFALPTELFPGWQFPVVAQRMPYFITYFYSPFQRNEYIFNASLGWSVGGLTYFVLLLVGLVSFVLRWQLGWRLLLWLAFAGLSATNYRLIPFFAVIAGPITALNLQDILTAYNAGKERTAKNQWLALRGRELSFVVGVALLFVAWPGWLLSYPGNPQLGRHVGWGIEVEPSLVKLANQLAAWRRQDVFHADEHGFSNRPEVIHYCAWFAPGERGFFDNRLALFGPVALDYADLLEQVGAAVPTYSLPVNLSKRGIAYVILHSDTAETLLAEGDRRVSRLLDDPQHWTLLYLDGRNFVFGWNEALTGERLERLRYDFPSRAFGAHADRVPPHGPSRGGQPQDFWARYLFGSRPRPLGNDETVIQMFFAQVLGTRRVATWPFAQTARVVGLSEAPSGALAGFTALIAFPDQQQERSLAAPDPQTPVAPLVLAVRAARRALAEEPDDSEAYLRFFQALSILANHEDRWANAPIPPAPAPELLLKGRRSDSPVSAWVIGRIPKRSLLRRAEEVGALGQFLAFQPDAFNVHILLADRYRAMGYYDLEVDHLRRAVDTFQQAEPGKRPRDLEDFFKKQGPFLAGEENALKELRAVLGRVAAAKPPAEKAMLAFQRLGLAQEAMTILTQPDVGPLAPDVAGSLLYLRLTTGRTEEMRNNPTSTGGDLPAFQAACVGELAAAGGGFEALADNLGGQKFAPLPFALISSTLGRTEPHFLPRVLVQVATQGMSETATNSLRRIQLETAQWLVVRGLLALEEGDNPAATLAFTRALEVCPPETRLESRVVAERYLELLKAHQND